MKIALGKKKEIEIEDQELEEQEKEQWEQIYLYEDMNSEEEDE